MRTKTLLIAAAALAAGIASSVAQSNVYSLNVVGYVNKTFTGGSKYTAVANPLNTTNNTLAGLFGGAGTGIPSGSSVQKWDTTLQDFVGYTKTGFGAGWSPAAGATVSLAPGEAVFVFITGTDYTNTFVGEVLQGGLTNVMVTAFNMIGNKAPDSGPVNTLNLAPNTGSVLQKWDVGLQDFVGYTKTGFGIGWSPSVPSIDVAEGFFINNNGAYTWGRNFTVQ